MDATRSLSAGFSHGALVGRATLLVFLILAFSPAAKAEPVCGSGEIVRNWSPFGPTSLGCRFEEVGPHEPIRFGEALRYCKGTEFYFFSDSGLLCVNPPWKGPFGLDPGAGDHCFDSSQCIFDQMPISALGGSRLELDPESGFLVVSSSDPEREGGVAIELPSPNAGYEVRLTPLDPRDTPKDASLTWTARGTVNGRADEVVFVHRFLDTGDEELPIELTMDFGEANPAAVEFLGFAQGRTVAEERLKAEEWRHARLYFPQWPIGETALYVDGFYWGSDYHWGWGKFTRGIWALSLRGEPLEVSIDSGAVAAVQPRVNVTEITGLDLRVRGVERLQIEAIEARAPIPTSEPPARPGTDDPRGGLELDAAVGVVGIDEFESNRLAVVVAPRVPLHQAERYSVALSVPVIAIPSTWNDPWRGPLPCSDPPCPPDLEPTDLPQVNANDLMVGPGLAVLPGPEVTFSPGRRLQPAVFAGVGFVHEEGRSTSFEGKGTFRTTDNTAAALTYGGALRLSLSPRTSLRFEARGITSYMDHMTVLDPSGNELFLEGGRVTSVLISAGLTFGL